MKFWEDFPKEVAFELCGEKRGPRLSSKLDFKHCSSFYAGPREPQRGRQAVVVCWGGGRFHLSQASLSVPKNGAPLSS